MIKKILKLHYLPLALLGTAIVMNHLGGNDKAPFLVLACGGVSVVLGLVYFITLSPIKGMISLAPGMGLAVLIGLAKLGLVDPMPILGFR